MQGPSRGKRKSKEMDSERRTTAKKEDQERLDRSWPVLTATFEALPLPVNGCKKTQ
jgi:hypothetical protein